MATDPSSTDPKKLLPEQQQAATQVNPFPDLHNMFNPEPAPAPRPARRRTKGSGKGGGKSSGGKGLVISGYGNRSTVKRKAKKVNKNFNRKRFNKE